MIAEKRKQRLGGEAPRVEASDAGAADRVLLIGVGLLIELRALECGERAAELDQDFGGRRASAVHGLRSSLATPGRRRGCATGFDTSAAAARMTTTTARTAHEYRRVILLRPELAFQKRRGS